MNVKLSHNGRLVYLLGLSSKRHDKPHTVQEINLTTVITIHNFSGHNI